MKHLIFSILFLFALSMQAQTTSYICQGSTKTLTAAGSTGTAPYTYVWTKPNASTVSTAAVTADIAGTYSYVVTDATGCTASGQHIIVIEANPTVTVNAANSCINTSQSITATGVPAGYTYAWTFGAGSTPGTSTTASTSVAYSTAGAKTVQVILSKTIAGTNVGTDVACGATCAWTKTANITIGSITGTSTCN
jgi:hypothetical protein